MAGSLGLRTAFGGQKVQSIAQRAKLAQAPVVKGAAVSQRLKPGKPPGTQRLTPKQAPSLPSGTQVKKKVGPPDVKSSVLILCAWRCTHVIGGCCQLSSIGLFGAGKEGLRARKQAAASPRLLARLEQLRLLSKAEQAGLLSLAERNGLTLTFIEESGEQPVRELLSRTTASLLETLGQTCWLLGTQNARSNSISLCGILAPLLLVLVACKRAFRFSAAVTHVTTA